MQWLSVSQPSQQQSPINPLDEFQAGYSRFQYECCMFQLGLSKGFSWIIMANQTKQLTITQMVGLELQLS
jgi:hypothetical protein